MVNTMLFVWGALVLAFSVVEIITLGLTTIWIAIGALVGLFVCLIGGPVWLQIALGFIVSIVLLVFTRPWAVKHLNNRITKTNVESIVGKTGVVSERIHNINAEGAVLVDGVEWSARAESSDAIIEKDEKVVVVRVEGVKLICKRNKEDL